MLPVVALKVAEVPPAVTITDVGTVSTVFVFVRVTVAPPAGAAAVNATVQLVAPFAPRLLGLHVSVDTDTDAVTVRPVDPLIPPEVAWIVALPVATPVARPAAVMLATPVLLELHVTDAVRFCVLLSL